MNFETHISIYDLIIFIGVFQGLLLSWFFVRNGLRENRANLYQGILLLFLALMMFEELLNNTGYIVQMLPITNYAEPLNFSVAPLFYFYVVYSLDPDDRRKVWPHFVLSMLWLLYMVLFAYFQPDEVKYNSYVQTKHPDWPYLEVPASVDDDPFHVRHYINQMTAVQFIAYMAATILVLLRGFRLRSQPVFGTKNETLLVLRNTTIHFLVIIAVFLGTKFYYGMGSDIGGYLISAYISFMIFTTSYHVLGRSDFFKSPHSFLDFPISKYQKSALTEEAKEGILKKIEVELGANRYFSNNLASLSGLSKQIGESNHHVSQVINERLHMNFFELLAKYRVEEASRILQSVEGENIIVEELADRVGYNSKSAFNNAFKKITGKTPTEFRKGG